MLRNRLGHAKAITHILADPSQVVDLGRIDEKIRLIQAPLRSDQGATHNPDAVCDALLELSRAL